MTTLQVSPANPEPSSPQHLSQNSTTLGSARHSIIHDENATFRPLDVVAFLLPQTNRKDHGGAQTTMRGTQLDPQTLKCFTDKWSTFTTISTFLLDTEVKRAAGNEERTFLSTDSVAKIFVAKHITQSSYRCNEFQNDFQHDTINLAQHCANRADEKRGSKDEITQPVRPQFVQKVVQ